MRITEAGFTILPTPHTQAEILKHIERCGRVCYKSEDKITEDSAQQFVANIIKRGHEAVLEHGILRYLRMDGPQAAASWETNGALRGAFSMRSFGESPSAAVESRLSQILQDNPPPKYYLSAKSCLGILNRAKRRGKKLPEQLRLALIQQSQGASQPDTTGARA